jgi:hypothetical protein
MPAVTHYIGAMMQPFKLTMTLSAILCMYACTGTKPAVSFNDEFITSITGDGTKFFTYIRHLPEGTEGGRGKGKNKSDNSLQEAVQARLDTSGYCRDGYLALERYHANGIARIRGECRDGANDSDREQFPNQP